MKTAIFSTCNCGRLNHMCYLDLLEGKYQRYEVTPAF